MLTSAVFNRFQNRFRLVYRFDSLSTRSQGKYAQNVTLAATSVANWWCLKPFRRENENENAWKLYRVHVVLGTPVITESTNSEKHTRVKFVSQRIKQFVGNYYSTFVSRRSLYIAWFIWNGQDLRLCLRFSYIFSSWSMCSIDEPMMPEVIGKSEILTDSHILQVRHLELYFLNINTAFHSFDTWPFGEVKSIWSH